MGCGSERNRTPNFCLIPAAPAGRLGPGLPCDGLAAAARLAAGVAFEAGPVTNQREVAALGAAVSFVTLEPRRANLLEPRVDRGDDANRRICDECRRGHARGGDID